MLVGVIETDNPVTSVKVPSEEDRVNVSVFVALTTCKIPPAEPNSNPLPPLLTLIA